MTKSNENTSTLGIGTRELGVDTIAVILATPAVEFER
jgi:hypothetical protein